MAHSFKWQSLLGLVVCFGGTALWASDSSNPAKIAANAWEVTTVVLDNHVNPPTRQEMLLFGVRAVFKQAGQNPPPDLSKRLSAVASEEQWKAFMSENWPEAAKDSTKPEDVNGALIPGLLRAVPGDTHLVSAADRKAIEGFAGNRYVGTGVQVGYSPNYKLAHIMSPIRHGPAHKAGARPNDLILEIDGKDVHDVGLKHVVDLLRGDEGTDVTVVVRQPKSDEKRTLRITRGVSPIESVVGHSRGEGDRWQFRIDPTVPIGYVAILSLNSSTLQELKVMEAQLIEDGVKALVLDLRFAQSGSAHNAALVADGLLDGGLMWRVRDSRQNLRECRADREALFRGLPMVVLVDQLMSAPFAWIAAALQDNKRAVLVGQTLVRDGYTKSFVEVPGGEWALEMATAHVERGKTPKPSTDERSDPSRYIREEWIIEPQHVVNTTPPQRGALHQRISEHLRTEPTPGFSATPPKDAQLAKALEVLDKRINETNKSEDAEKTK